MPFEILFKSGDRRFRRAVLKEGSCLAEALPSGFSFTGNSVILEPKEESGSAVDWSAITEIHFQWQRTSCKASCEGGK